MNTANETSGGKVAAPVAAPGEGAVLPADSTAPHRELGEIL